MGHLHVTVRSNTGPRETSEIPARTWAEGSGGKSKPQILVSMRHLYICKTVRLRIFRIQGKNLMSLNVPLQWVAKGQCRIFRWIEFYTQIFGVILLFRKLQLRLVKWYIWNCANCRSIYQAMFFILGIYVGRNPTSAECNINLFSTLGILRDISSGA